MSRGRNHLIRTLEIGQSAAPRKYDRTIFLVIIRQNGRTRPIRDQQVGDTLNYRIFRYWPESYRRTRVDIERVAPGQGPDGIAGTREVLDGDRKHLGGVAMEVNNPQGTARRWRIGPYGRIVHEPRYTQRRCIRKPRAQHKRYY